MARNIRVATAGAVIAALASGTLAIGPASAGAAELQYMNRAASVAEAVATVTQLLSSGTTINGKTWQGTPDGMGGVKNADGTITVFVNHELSASDAFVAKTEQSYGGYGSTVSAVTYNPATQSITSIKDAIKKATWYDYSTGEFTDTPEAPEDAPDADAFATPNHTNNLNRFCSASLVATGGLSYTATEKVKYFVTKTVNGKKVKIAKYKTVKTTYGVKDPIFMTGEEGNDESRIFGLNTKSGELVQLPALGLGASENVNIAPASATRKATVALIGEDGEATDSQLFLYRGTKQKAGAWYQKAGLTDGLRYVSKVFSSGSPLANDVAARTALAEKSITSVVRGAAPAAITKVKVVAGQLTLTTAAGASVKAGDVVTLAGLATVGGVDLSSANGENTVVSATSTTIVIGADADDLAETVTDAGTVAIAADTVVISATAHGLVEGDTVSLRGITDSALAGKYVVTGAPSANVFTVTAAGAALNLTGGSAHKMLDVSFKKVPTDLAGDAQQVLAKLRGTVFARVEDAAFNPQNANEFFFITTQSDSDGVGVAGVKESGRDGGALWKMTFADVAHPELGAQLELVLNGTEAPANDPAIKINKPDNLTVTNDGKYILVQEDPGGNDHISRLLAVRLSDNKLVSVAEFSRTLFAPNSVNSYITNDEESSGVFDATSLLAGAGDTASYFFFNAQVHPIGKDGGGNSLSADALKARVVAMMRPDLIAQTNLAITNVNRASASATSITVTVSDLGGLAVNDTVTLLGLTKELNGTYAVTGVNADAKTFTVKVAATLVQVGDFAGTVNSVAITTDAAAEAALKDTIIEGGALYTLKISDWDALFNTAPLV